MSLENDITQIKEADIFKPADKAELDRRRTEADAARQAKLAELRKQPLKPVDDEAVTRDGVIWTAEQKLRERLAELRAQYHDEECHCGDVVDALQEEGDDVNMEYAALPGENGYLDAFCLRCGGRFDAW